jgi:hypothetical protein
MLKEEFKGGTIYTGTRGPHYWLTSIEQYMGAVVQLCPDVIPGRYLTVTAIDGGTPWLTDAQRAAGWRLRSGMAHSQRVSAIEELFYQRDGADGPGYDEWYLFDTPAQHLGEILAGNPFVEENKPRPGRLLVFVVWGGFALHEMDPAEQTFTDMFWQQMDWIQPEVYISDGRESLTFVCKDRGLFESVHDRLSHALKI